MDNQPSFARNSSVYRQTKATPDSLYSEITNVIHKVNENIQQPGKSFAWSLVIFIFIASLLVCIIWFIHVPTSFGFDNSLSSYEMGVNGFYYWATVTSTVGFGDICPKTINSKIFTSMYQLFITAVSLGVLWNITDDALRQQLRGLTKQ